ncbi:hypothetical protein HYDPIDRAFT_40094 [Hydnomerulius pinastri MD-312]|uniref:Methyltransferase domain-containing protein n=1 Tax=Hydnomerulius pinastri MD-312 TaxID=994086 RepID=A0A0C9WFK5_9AGAM|nr:hypothetical protein HYDPIDRAFT_40094 [Hydnomerulius pinastri MD-312]
MVTSPSNTTPSLLGGREYHDTTSNYSLPKDAKEHYRLDVQHDVIKDIAGGNYVAPLQNYEGAVRDILDLGCGNGRWAIEIAQEFPAANVIGVDLSPVEKELLPQNCKFIVADITMFPLPFEDSSFDVVQMRIVPSLPDRSKIIPEIYRVLRPNGFVLFLEPSHVISRTLPGRIQSPAFADGDRLIALSPHTNGRDWSIAEVIRGMLLNSKREGGESMFHAIGEITIHLPVGTWPEDPKRAQQGAIGAEMQIHLYDGFGPMLIKHDLISEGGFKDLMDKLTAETNDHSLQLEQPFVFAWGQKRL